MKKLISCLMALLTLLLPAAACGEKISFTVREMPFYLCDAAVVRTYPVRFPAGSDVPYVSLNDWAEIQTYLLTVNMPDGEENSYALTARMEGDSGILEREDGAQAVFDCDKDEIIFSNFDAFLRVGSSRYLIGVLNVDAYPGNGPAKYLSTEEVSYERAGGTVVLDLASYGIGMAAADGACYVPLQTLSDFFLSSFSMNVYYNGEAVFIAPFGSLTAPSYDTPLGELFYSVEPHERSEAMAAFTYAELCLALDHLYGLKEAHGIVSFDDLASRTGLKADLTGTDPSKADEALYRLLALHLDDNHSRMVSTSCLNGEDALYDLYETVPEGEAGIRFLEQYQTYLNARLSANPHGFQAYEEYGNTAYITLDNFEILRNDADYYETGPTQKGRDTIGIMLYAYRQIMREDSPIENVVLDISLNPGGITGSGLFTIAAFLGKASVSLEDKLSGALFTGSYQADMDLDGWFDENDLGLTESDLYCLVSPVSFSVSNLAAAMFRNSGRVTLLGQTSGGGSCAILPLSTADGASFQISGFECFSVVRNGIFQNIEQGAEPVLPLTRPGSFYDREALTEYINGLK